MTLLQASSTRNTIRQYLMPRRGDVALLVGAVLIPFTVFVILAVAVAGKGAIGWDAAILDLVERHYRQSLSIRLGSALDTGPALAGVTLVAALVLLLKRGRRREALFCILAVGGVLALDVPLKEAFQRPQWSPPGYDTRGVGYVFPSGHAMATMALLASMTLISTPRLAKLLLIVGVPLVAAVGVILVYSWWHYPSDVVAGWCLAVSWVAALWLAIRPKPGLSP